MNAKRVLIGVVIAGLVLVGISLNSSRRSSEPGGLTTRSPGSASLSPSGTPSASAATNALRLLPFTREQLSDAVQLATRFTAAYASYRFDEDPQTYLDRLNPMMSTQLQPVIARAATHPGTLDRRRRDHEVTVAHARPEAIRTLGPASITVLLTTTAKITNRHGDRQDTTRYAVTVTDHDGTWQVYAIELASTGNTGQSVTDGDPP